MAANEMPVSRLLETGRTTDLYDVVAAALNVLAGRGELTIEPDAINAEHAEIRSYDGVFTVVYWADPEPAERERDDQDGADPAPEVTQTSQTPA
jgi:hypothetical protein